MEVHHHPHVERKRFKEYFLEFLMIFLAVTLGFFAENIREHFSNNEMANQLSRQVVQELKMDTAYLNSIIESQASQNTAADSLFSMLQNPIDKIDAIALERLTDSCFYITAFTPSSGAINSIKNKIDLKQFSSTRISDYINDYEADKNWIKSIEATQVQQISQIIQKFMQQHFSANDFYKIRILHVKPGGVLRKISADDLEDFRAGIVTIEDFNHLLGKAYKYSRESAINFMQYVQKEYNIKDE